MALKFTSVLCVALFLNFVLTYEDSDVQINITAEPGQTVTLPCQTHPGVFIYGVRWTRPDLTECLILALWDPEESQHPSYKNRVELQDKQMKDGNLALILKNVTINDTGMYECHNNSVSCSRLDFYPISAVNLTVKPVQTPADLNLSVVRILLHLVVFCPFFISTLLMVSLYQCKPTGSNQPVSMTMSLSNRGGEDLDEHNDYIMDDVTIEHHHIIIKAYLGTTVTLPCRSRNNTRFTGVDWVKSDLEKGFVYLYRDGQPKPEDQHPAFKNRVELKDRNMKDGDVSLVLKNVMSFDGGSYVCYVTEKDANHEMTCTEPSFIYLIMYQPVPINITASSGQTVNLPCGVLQNTCLAMEWTRHELEQGSVLVYRDGQSEPEGQHPSFKKRVELKNGQMKDGGLSLILKEVTVNDTGTYECHVFPNEINFWESIIDLDVHQSDIHSDVTLPCRSPRNKSITAVMWTRSDLQPDSVYLYQDGQTDLERQHPSFKDRVELKDREMKNGDVSLILKNVTTDDNGRYKCEVIHNKTNWKTGDLNTVLVNVINLTVVEPGRNTPVSMTTPAPNEESDGLYEEFDEAVAHVTTEHHF
ncbi:uncharacterized protein LOC113168753 [Anabas testudineus]|uniref:uncharacterized protein LOC113168753 n=1 Tax=Anabas testudineus TaxID=64144 RepID=UPI00143D81F7|nr:uncharacterized protein LOC113168753 [Anabas testudineus]